MASNLPPGCSSPDGGIDHEYESALEAFMEIAQTADELKIACAVMPAILDAVRDSFVAGVNDTRMELEQERDNYE